MGRWFYYRALGCLHQCTACYTVTLLHMGGRLLLLKDQDQLSKRKQQHRLKQLVSFSPQTYYIVLLHHLF